MAAIAKPLVSADEIRDELIQRIVRRLRAMKPLRERCQCPQKRTIDNQEHEPMCPGFWYDRAINTVEAVREEL